MNDRAVPNVRRWLLRRDEGGVAPFVPSEVESAVATLAERVERIHFRDEAFAGVKLSRFVESVSK